MKIVVLDASAANPGDLTWAPFEKFGEVICYDVTKKEQLIERAKGAEVLLTNKTIFEKDDFDKLPDLLEDCGFKEYVVYKNRKPEAYPFR